MSKQTPDTDQPTSAADVTAVVDALFDNDFLKELPDGFSDIAPKELVLEIARQKEKRGWSAKITLTADYDVEASKKFLHALDEGRQDVTGREFDEAWAAIKISMDISVMGGDEWCPRILPNGAVGWRNHHRVIGFDGDLKGSVAVSCTDLRTELQHLYLQIESEGELEIDDRYGFSLLHRDADGLRWTREIPATFSVVGQTLIMLPKDWLERAQHQPEHYPALSDELLLEAAENSRTGHCVLRVYRDRFFVHSTYRAGDEYDTILEEYSHSMGGGEPDGEVYKIWMTNNSESIRKTIAEQIRERNPEIFHHLWLSKVTTALAEDVLYHDYANSKTGQVMQWMPIFASRWNCPATYGWDYTPFWEQSEALHHQLVVIELRLSGVSKIKGLGKQLYKQFKQVVPAELCGDGVRLYIHTDGDLRWTSDSNFFAFNSPEAQARFDEIEQEWKQTYKKEKKENKNYEEYQFLLDQEGSVCFLIPTKDTSPETWHAATKRGSGKIAGSVCLTIPVYGLIQTYDAGDFDSGNVEKYMDISGFDTDDEDDEEEYEEE